tara:strand:- start:230 stop:607 length:378 start_codon:yes stop_codon:yes gene_type:complete
MAFVGPFQSGTATSATLDQALTSILTVHTEQYKRLFVRVTASVQAFDQFQVSARCVAGSTNAVVANTGGGFNSPARPMLGASGDLTALSGATGWFYMDVEGIFEVDVAIAFAVDNGTYVIEYSVQ